MLYPKQETVFTFASVNLREQYVPVIVCSKVSGESRT